jgi:outer membrane protein insertion porin family
MPNKVAFSFSVFLLACLLCGSRTLAQSDNTGGARNNGAPTAPKTETYTIGGITVSGNKFLDEDLLLAVTGLTVGGTVKLPNDESISRAIRNLWKQDLFSDISIRVTKVIGTSVFLDIAIEERPRLSRFNFRGIKKGEATDLKDKVNLVKSRVMTEAIKQDAVGRIRKFYVDKGFGQVKIKIIERPDTTIANSVVLTFDIDKGGKTRINHINIAGNEYASDARLKRAFKGSKEMPRITLRRADEDVVYPTERQTFGQYIRSGGFLSVSKTLAALDPYFRLGTLLSSSKFNQQKFDDDKEAVIAYYNTLGYRDAAIESDTVYPTREGNLNLEIKVREGRRYRFGDLTWRGNTKYSDEQLSRILGIKKGDYYNQGLLEARIGTQLSPDGSEDVSSLYMDDGYLFFRIEPRELSVVNDTINYEMVVTEGPQATIKNVTITGNDRTNEHVIRRELRTYPGNKFSRADLIRSQRQIANLGFFDPEKTGISPKPNPEDGTVDIEYAVTEKSSDQLQLSAGFGGGVRFYGNIGISFNNFSIRNILKPRSWDPLPMGDGQKLSINYQSNGASYNSFNFSFTEPWLGGKKPNSLTTSFVYSRYSGSAQDPSASYLRVLGGGVSVSRRLQWPDDNFLLTTGVNLQDYRLKNYALVSDFNNGTSDNLFFRMVIARYTVDQPLYPRGGSNIEMIFQLTPPWSAFSGKDFKDAGPSEKYKLIEYHKYRFKAEWFKGITSKVVFKLSTKYGFLGYYNSDIGFSPFERFQLGGDGLSGQQAFVGRDVIAHRGYEVYAQNATIFNKYTAEIRYPFSLNPTSTIYGLAFIDAANAWNNFKEYNPFKLQRSAGVGIRIFLPMFGLLGLDYGVGFDRYNKAAGITGFRDISKFTFMLGFEPD